jgi:hypothetical protein
MMPRLEQDVRHRNGRVGRRAWLAACAATLGTWVLPSWLSAAPADEADTSARARDEAIGSLPLSKLTAESRRKLLAVCENPSLFRRMPQKTVNCDPDLYRFLVRNPEVVVNIWQLMGFSNYSAERTGAYMWRGDDGTGTTGDVELVYGTDEMHVLYGDGLYEGSLLRKKITGRCVLILHSGYGQDTSRRALVGNRLDLFLQLDNVGADIMARTFAPWVGKVADTNFAESCKFAAKVSQTAETNGPGMQRLADKLTAVQPEVREEFARVSSAVHERAAARDSGDRMR